ncbi:hypothetical protein AGMMS49992_13270 [Clostridia bacterium]|nr:hypothetical protein AGMMS49992_13270 [Clostridia bacterium]
MQADKNRIQWFSTVRTLGICLVLIYHLLPDSLPGGFIGVDVLFTFSGYLVTALAILQFSRASRDEGFSAQQFYIKRIKRIVPPLVLAVLITLPFALMLDPEFVVQLGRRLSATFSFVRNYYEIIRGGSYEETMFPRLYVHTWSLAVEMQLYLVWGAVLAALAAIAKRQVNTVKSMRRLTACVSVAFAVVSYLMMQRMFRPEMDPAAAYYATHSHAYPFFIGSAAACALGVNFTKRFRRFATGAGRPIGVIGAVAAAFALVGLSRVLAYSSAAVYRWGFVAASVLTVLLIISARILHDAFPQSIEPRALTFFSDISYYVFLLHWPIFIIINNHPATWFGVLSSISNETARLIIAAGVIVITLGVSVLCIFVLEPMVSGRRKRRRFGGVFSTAILALCAVLCVVAIGGAPAVSPMSKRFANEYLSGDIRNLARFAQRHAAANASAVTIMQPLPTLDSTPIPTLTPTPIPTPIPTARLEFTPAITAEPTATPILPPTPLPTPTAIPTPIPLGSIVMLGDSVTLGAKSALEDGINNLRVDAKGSRNLLEGPDLLKDYIQKGRLSDCVVVALGTNGTRFFEDMITDMINMLPDGHRLIFVTPYDGRWTKTWASFRTTAYLRSIDGMYPFVTIADWAKVVDGHLDWLTTDKVHLRNSKAVATYVDVINSAISIAKGKSVKGGSEALAVVNIVDNALLPSGVIVDTKHQGVVSTSGNPLNVRASASVDGQYLGQISTGTAVECYETIESSDWLYVVFGDLTGYASARYIRR